jgi:hypothetical protein
MSAPDEPLTPDKQLDLILGRMSDLQGQIAALHDEVLALKAELHMHLDTPLPGYSGSVQLPLVGLCPITLAAGREVDK